jgi:GNAT superfamily N-acetyltransferase
VIAIDRSIQELWESILNNPSLHYLGAYVAGELVSTCTLTIIPNLTRGARPYAVIENVVTHPQFRRRGLATQVLQHALRIAWAQGCYKVMLLTGSKQEATLRFYEKAGFRRGDKTGFVAHPPSG